MAVGGHDASVEGLQGGFFLEPTVLKGVRNGMKAAQEEIFGPVLAVIPWKDEDELAERLEHPEHYWVDDEAAVWAEGRRMIALAEAGAYPFDGTWVDFRPDPTWLMPDALPAGWDRPRAR